MGSREQPSFLGINRLIQGSDNVLDKIVDEAANLSIRMCVADAMYDNKIINNVQRLQSRSLHLLEDLSEQIKIISDGVSVQQCKRMCKDIMDEVDRDVLSIETEVLCKGDSSSKATVRSSITTWQPKPKTHVFVAVPPKKFANVGGKRGWIVLLSELFSEKYTFTKN